MNGVDLVLGRPLADALGWALLHSLWQGALIGLIAAAALAALRGAAANVRYLVASVALLLTLALPAATAWTRYAAGVAEPVVRASAGGAVVPAAGTQVPDGPRQPIPTRDDAAGAPIAGNVERWLPLAVLIWLVGVAVLSLRLISGWAVAQRLRVHQTSAAPPALERLLEPLCRRLHVRRPIRLRVSGAVDVPTVIGWLRPMLLVPASALAGLSPDQLSAILAHELAHVRRHDYLVNLLQSVVETLLFYHPAVWWISRRVRVEREHCCDDLAVAVSGDPVQYARALASLEEQRGGHRAFALAASGGSLVSRVRRLLGAPAPHDRRSPAVLAAFAAVAIFVVAVTAGAELARTDPPMAVDRAAAAADLAVAQEKSEGHFSWTKDGRRFEMQYDGRIELTDDERDIKSLSPGGYLIIKDGRWWWFADYRLDIRADSAGRLERKFWVDGRERPYEPEGREWLAKSLIRLVRTTGLWADARIARIMKARGPQGVLDEIAQLEGDYVRRIYFETLFKAGPLDAATLARALTLTGQLIASDYELSHVLRQAGQSQGLADAAVQAAYVEAATHVSSDYELSRTLRALIDRGSMPEPLLTRIVDAATRIDSDYELSQVLRAVSARHPLTGATRTAFFRALDGISSDYERGRVLASVGDRGDVGPDVAASLLQASRAIGSDYELAKFLLSLAERHDIDGPLAADFFKAVEAIQSAYERQRVLAAVAGKPGLSPATLVALLQSASGIGSDYELARLLIRVAETHTIEGPVRDAYLAAAERVQSSHETGRIMTALVRSETRK